VNEEQLFRIDNSLIGEGEGGAREHSRWPRNTQIVANDSVSPQGMAPEIQKRTYARVDGALMVPNSTVRVREERCAQKAEEVALEGHGSRSARNAFYPASSRLRPWPVLWARGRRYQSSLSLYSHDSSACQVSRGPCWTPLMTSASAMSAVMSATAQRGAVHSASHHLLPDRQKQACCTGEVCPGMTAVGIESAEAQGGEANSLGKPREWTLC
jgi:hypothetical protein